MIVLLTCVIPITTIQNMDTNCPQSFSEQENPSTFDGTPPIFDSNPETQIIYTEPAETDRQLFSSILLASTFMSNAGPDYCLSNYSGSHPYYDLVEKMELAKEQQNSFSHTLGHNANKPHLKPVDGSLSQDFHPGHCGVDTAVQIGSPIKATMSGQVVFAGWHADGFGNLIIISNLLYQTFYAHLSGFLVEIGNMVDAGMTIGFSGNTGNTTGPHLHYEIRKNGIPQDPCRYYSQHPT